MITLSGTFKACESGTQGDRALSACTVIAQSG
jgi:hypothetical protein